MSLVIDSKQFNCTWRMLQVTYALVPIIIGLDKCFGWWLVNWAQYLSPVIQGFNPIPATTFIVITGVIEIIAGLLVFFKPRFGAYLIFAWLLLVVIDLATMQKFYDIIARDLVIAIGVLAFAWLTHIKETAHTR